MCPLDACNGLNRLTETRISNGKTNKPIAKFYPLEVTDDSTTSMQNTVIEEHDNTSTHVRPPRHIAAQKATRQMTEWAKILDTPRRMWRTEHKLRIQIMCLGYAICDQILENQPFRRT